ncbi:Pre-mRNA-splicing factor sap61 [Mycoemilia scoparia]|uniref:Pre-mRNA-splicing factor sap61 n=1 Tax=Mycoemilia scoparia TaxID=417184 RepID=A0A9W8DPX4_9FUNG|nr:Pre-mRNA-splicing factor sap61 [Mycoemilia scoparia]
MESIIEQQRIAFEEIERLQQASVDLYLQPVLTHKDNLLREQKISHFVDQIQKLSKTQLEVYNDESEKRKKELTDMSGNSAFKEFYSRLDDIKHHHKQNPFLVAEPMELEYLKYKRIDTSENGRHKIDDKDKDNKPDESLKLSFATEQDYEQLEAMFSGEEVLGRYLDLNVQHTIYLNLKGASKLSYIDYLKQFGAFERYPQANKNANYLEQFEKDWKSGKAKGWDLNQQQEKSNDLFCTPCNKLFQTESTFKNHLGGRKHKKAATKVLSTADNPGNQKADLPHKHENIARLEYIIREYIQVLKKTIQNTHENVERKQALTGNERDQEMQEENIEIPDSDEDDEEHIYNPLKLPLGWDGKPIPYWLYKLHGLGVEYPCEICGNYIYKGRKAFDRHFQEARHASNMRRLGITNTRQFHDITKIDDAIKLWEKVKQQSSMLSSAVANPETFEEFEDNEGNVFNKKTYEDLKRQGLI